MPIEYKLEQNGALVLANATGVLTVDCFLFMQQQMRADPQLRDSHSTLLDVRCVTDIQIAKEDLDQIGRNLGAGPKKLGAKKLAIVATQTQAFDLGDDYGKTQKHLKETVIVFCQMDIARIWLGID